MAFQVGGPTPLPEHHVLTVKAPTGINETTGATVEQWAALAMTGYNSIHCADGEAPVCFAMHRVTRNDQPLGVILVGGKHTVIHPEYAGTAPATGTTIIASPDGKVKAGLATGVGYVMEVDVASRRVQVLI